MYVKHPAHVDFNTARIVITDHLLLRLSQYTRLKNISMKFLKQILSAGIDPSERQIKKQFAYTDNRNKIIVYSQIFKVFFVMKFDGSDLIVMTCVKEK